jgi:arylsulfatase A-like enzyme
MRQLRTMSPVEKRSARAGDHEDQRIDRRTLIRRGVVAAGALAAGGLGLEHLLAGGGTPARPKATRAPGAPPGAPHPPNVLIVIVDQLRAPCWFPSASQMAALLPNISRLRSRSVSFARHYTAANDCTPARAAMLTGLYPHQTGCLITGRSTLQPGFPTYGSMLRELGYRTVWYGKWHLARGDNHWYRQRQGQSLEPYGFAGGTYPSPDGAPGQGLRKDPHIASQFEHWLAGYAADAPWCATVSFVNPHDIAWWYRRTERTSGERWAPPVFKRLPANFQTPEQLLAAAKPRLQLAFLHTAAEAFGEVPYAGPHAAARWASMLDLYLKLQQAVDHQIGRVLRALESRPAVAQNTVVIFTSDHGEYAASHGLRGKGGGAYEEGIRVPLYLHDPRGKLAAAPASERTQLTSSVDIPALLLTIATGSAAWRADPAYSHIAGRADIAAIAANPAAPSRDFIVHVTDEITTEFAPTTYERDTPLHVIALRTPTAKYATYSHWRPDTSQILARGQERELYDHSTARGRLELHNQAGHSQLEDSLDELLHRKAIPNELRQPLPARLAHAQQRGFEDYVKSLPKHPGAPSSRAPAATKRRSLRRLGAELGGR